MAGGRSQGCATCRKRKIKVIDHPRPRIHDKRFVHSNLSLKCDQRRPVCYFCEKAQRKCQAWPQAFQFVLYRACPRQKARRLVRTATPSLANASEYRKSGQVSDAWPSGDAAPTLTPRSSPLPVSKLPAKLSEVLDITHGTGFDLRYMGEYFSGLSVRAVQDDCLCAAVECIWTAHQRLWGSQQIGQCSSEYGRALRLLRERLDSTKQPAGAESLCAALILAVFMLLDESGDAQQYLTHAAGASAILKAWGPEQIDSRFGLQLFYAHVPGVVLTSLIAREKCFVDSAGWRELIDKIPPRRLRDRLEARILHTYARIPTLFSEIRDPVSQSRNNPHDDLSIYVHEFRQKLGEIEFEMYQVLRHEYAAVDGSDHELLTLVANTCFNDVRLTEATCIYWRTSLLFSKALSRTNLACRTDTDRTQRAVEFLCMCSEHAQKFAPFGSLLAYCNLTIVQLADISTYRHAWIQEVIGKAQQSCSPQTRRALGIYTSAMKI